MNIACKTIGHALRCSRTAWPMTVLICGLALMAGCQRGESNVNSADRPKSPLAGTDTATHVVTTDAVYYRSGPQQGRPPDGTLKTGTKVRLVEDQGSYWRVRTAEGIECSVERQALAALAK